MEDRFRKRKWTNLAKGIACLAVGAIAVAAIEILWDHAMSGEREPSMGGPHDRGEESAPPEYPGYSDMLSYALEERPAAIGSSDLPDSFIEECFDARKLGEARCSADGGVIGITSNMPASDLFEGCVGELTGNGWLRMESGYPLRCTFLKEGGSFHWLFLDVNQVSGSGVAVMVVEEGSGS